MITITLTYDTSKRPGNHGAYRILAATSDDMATEKLTKHGATENNIATYRGVFSKRSSAARAIMNYFPGIGSLVRIEDLSGQVTWQIQPFNQKPSEGAFDDWKVLFSRSQNGEFVARD